MRKSLTLLFSLFCAATTFAQQLPATGYYRVQAAASGRYITIVSDKAAAPNYTAGKYDFMALRTVRPYENYIDDPSLVFYVTKQGSSNEYNLRSQGGDAHSLVGRYLKVSFASGSTTQYYAYGEAQGLVVYLYDEPSTRKDECVLLSTGNEAQRRWKVLPVSATDDANFFGLHSEFTVGSQRYTSLYADFPYTFASQGMKAYTVTKVDGDMAVMTEVSGKVAQGTPVIIQCAGTEPSDNRLNIEMQNGSAPKNNQLKGTYWENSHWFYPTNDDGSKEIHFKATAYDPATMRLLGVTKEGKLGFVTADVTYVPRNRAYLVVPAGSPAEITLVSQAEYDAEVAKDKVTVKANDKSRVYGEANPTFDYTVEGTLKGEPTLTCAATATSPVGTYPIVVAQGTSTNRQFTGVNGTLTVTQAALTVTARSYTIKQNEALPTFQADYSGFKNGETASVLTAQPVFTCDVPEAKTPGNYPIVVSGAAAQNYAVSFVAGTLTIQEADPITITAADLTMVYGDQVPELTYSVSGGTVSGQPVLSCEATSASLPGTYPITVAQGTVSYPNLTLVNGTLTITKAPLKASVGSYTRLEGEPNPDFEVVYEGFRNGDDASVLTVAPTATTLATAESPAGTYDITVGGGQSDRYEFTYVAGTLTIQALDAIRSMVFQRPVDVYTLAGRLVRSQVTTVAGLSAGLYIVEGRKVVIR